MSSYSARLQLPGRTRIPMSVTVDVSGETLTLNAEDKKIGVWSLRDIDVDPRSDGFHLRIDGEDAVLTVSEATQFATELQLSLPAKQAQTPQQMANAPTAGRDSGRMGNKVIDLIGGLGQEDELADVRRRLNDLREDLRNPAIAPAVVFSRWLALLKVLNRRHGQGAMPTALFFRLNTELLDLMPVPANVEASNV